MKSKYLIDVNILIQPYLNQDRAEICADLLNKLDDGEIEAKVTLFHLDAAAIILENRDMSQNEIAEFYFRAYQCDGLEIATLGISGRLNALANDKYEGLDDSLILQAKKDLKIDQIITYDKDFNKDIRAAPEEILN
jgi:predicted nucleic acid-binding protein